VPRRFYAPVSLTRDEQNHLQSAGGSAVSASLTEFRRRLKTKPFMHSCNQTNC